MKTIINWNFLFLIFVFFSHLVFSQESSSQIEYAIKTLDINSKYSEMGTTFFGKHKIFFASNKTDAKSVKKFLNAFNTTFEGPTYDLYEGAIDSEGNVSQVTKTTQSNNIKFNESNPTFTSDLKYVYFTQNNIKEGKYIEDKNGNVNMKIYRASIDAKGEWINIVSLPFNSDYYSCAHPSLSEDNQILFFSSNRDNPSGSSDLYWVTIYENGSFGNPEKLKNNINSTYRDNFPFVVENWLYFSSDRPGGRGGLDVYRIDLSVSDAIPVNVGAPVNSESDDFGLVMDRDMKQGYFTSNRTSGEGQDDIFFFKQLNSTYDCKQNISGYVYDSITKKTILDAKVDLFDNQNEKLASFNTNKTGFYSFDSPCKDIYNMHVQAVGYSKSYKKVTFTPYYFKKEVDLYLTPMIFINDTIHTPAAKEPLTLFKNHKEILNIPTVYFNLDEHTLTAEGKKTVEKAVDILLLNPTWQIEFACHTDTRASFSYNLHLSDLRAQEVLNYMLEFGIDPKRISGKGYGETQPVNKCFDGVYCTEAEHMQNRRAEFEVLNK